VIGAAVTMTRICESNVFPLLSRIIRNSSDHTSRNKITIGGNICGRIPYRESVLPFMLCDGRVEIAGPKGIRLADINSAFNECLILEKGEFLIRILTDKKYTELPFEAVKRTRQERVDYPLVSVAAVKKDNQIRAAFSGVCAFSFRSKLIEEYLSNSVFDENQMSALESLLPGPILSNLQGSSDYRKYVLGNILSDIIEKMGGL
jgi:xanthine dehydrogenase molybdenum-binding subunit